MKTSLVTGLMFLSCLVLAPVVRSEQGEKAGSTWGQCSKRPVEPCFKHRGRLSSQNGIAHMIWLVGTKRIVAVANADDIPDMLLNSLKN